MECFSESNELDSTVQCDSCTMCVWIKVVTRNDFKDELMASKSEFICFFSDFKTCFGEVKSFLSAKMTVIKLILF